MLLEIGLLKKTPKHQKQNKTKTKQKKKKEKKKRNQNCIKSGLSQFLYISTTKDVICCSNGYIYHFLDCIKLLPMSFTMSKNVEHSSEKTPRELMERFTNLTSVISTHFVDQVQIFFLLTH